MKPFGLSRVSQLTNPSGSSGIVNKVLDTITLSWICPIKAFKSIVENSRLLMRRYHRTGKYKQGEWCKRFSNCTTM